MFTTKAELQTHLQLHWEGLQGADKQSLHTSSLQQQGRLTLLLQHSRRKMCLRQGLR